MQKTKVTYGCRFADSVREQPAIERQRGGCGCGEHQGVRFQGSNRGGRRERHHQRSHTAEGCAQAGAEAGSRHDGVCYVPCGGSVTYENGAEVGTSFVTNLETDLIVRTAPALEAAMRQANDENLGKKQFPKYSYPPEVITSAMVARWCSRGVDFRLLREDAARISALDAQRLEGKGIYGSGFLLSENATRDAETAEREAEAVPADGIEHVWELSERERDIIAGLGKNDDDRAERESTPEDSKR